MFPTILPLNLKNSRSNLVVKALKKELTNFGTVCENQPARQRVFRSSQDVFLMNRVRTRFEGNFVL